MVALTLSLNSLAQSEETTIVDRGPHQQTVRTISTELDENGEAVNRTNTFVQVQTGLNVWSQFERKYVEASDEVELANDAAVARKAQHRVIFARTLDDPDGTVDLEMPGGSRLRARFVGVAFTETDTGRSAFIGEAVSSVGALVGRNAIVYPRALDSIACDVRYTMRVDSLEQDVIFREQLGITPGDLGLNERTTVVEAWTEILEAVEPRVVKIGSNDQVDFGSMHLADGRAFKLAADGEPEEDVTIPIGRQWLSIAGRRFIVEPVSYLQLRPFLDELPARSMAQKVDRKRIEQLHARNSRQGRRAPMSLASSRSTRKSNRLARIGRGELSRQKGVVLDWQAVNGTLTNMAWRADRTYYVSGPTTLAGTNSWWEGGCVIKYAPTNTASITVNAPITWLASSYRPIVMTARDDSSVGESITNTAVSGYYANPAIKITTSNTQLRHLRVAYAQLGVFFFDTSAGSGNAVSHAQFVRCNNAMGVNGYGTIFQNFAVRNVLMTECPTAFHGYSFAGTVEHLSLNQCTQLGNDYNGATYGTTSSLALTNSLLAALGTNGNITVTQAYCISAASSNLVFQTVGAGGFYLKDASTNRNVGTTNINAAFAAELKTKTTYPPLILSNSYNYSLTLGPQALRDTDKPDLGYHYDPIDWAVNGLTMTNATLTLWGGVVLASFGNSGVWLTDGSQMFSEWTAQNRNRLCRYYNVQEQSTNWGNGSYTGTVTVNPYNNGVAPPRVEFRFTDFETMAAGGYHTYMANTNWVFASFVVEDCTFSSGYIYGGGYTNSTLILNNNLFESVAGQFWNAPQVAFYNNLYRGGESLYANEGTNNWTFKDNAFDSTSLLDFGNALTHSHNVYINMAGRLYPTNASDKVLTNFTYGSGPLGRYYQITTNLLDGGSRNADMAGLYQYTVKTDQLKERDSVVDIGFHYPAINTAVPSDRDGDGISDVDEIILGTNPTVANTDGDSLNDGQDAFPLDPGRTTFPAFNPLDSTAPTITLDEPVNVTLLP